jgi:hypothetical protein
MSFTPVEEEWVIDHERRRGIYVAMEVIASSGGMFFYGDGDTSRLFEDRA